MRLSSLAFLFLAALCAGYDAWEYVDNGDLQLIRSDEVWAAVHIRSLDFMRTLIQSHFASWFWVDVVRPVIQLPAVLVLGGLALAFALPTLGRVRSKSEA